MHGEMSESIDAVLPADRPMAIDRAWDRGMLACSRGSTDPEVVFVSAAAILRLGDPGRACELATRAAPALRQAGVAAEDSRWIDVFAAACAARSSPRDASVVDRFARALESVAGSSRAADFLLGCYVYAVALQPRDDGFLALVAGVVERPALDPRHSITGTVLLLVSAADARSAWDGVARSPIVLEAVERWTRPPFADSFAPVLFDLTIAALPACAEARDLARLESIIPALRLSALRTGSIDRRLTAEAYIASYERSFGLRERAEATLDAMVDAPGASAAVPQVWDAWLPERLKLALAGPAPRDAVARIFAHIERMPWAASTNPGLAAALRACMSGDAPACASALRDWQVARIPSLGEEQRADDAWLVRRLGELAASEARTDAPPGRPG